MNIQKCSDVINTQHCKIGYVLKSCSQIEILCCTYIPFNDKTNSFSCSDHTSVSARQMVKGTNRQSNDFDDNVRSSQGGFTRKWELGKGRMVESDAPVQSLEQIDGGLPGAEKKRCFHRLTAFEAEWRWSLNGTAAAVNAVRPLFCPATNTFDKYNQAKPN